MTGGSPYETPAPTHIPGSPVTLQTTITVSEDDVDISGGLVPPTMVTAEVYNDAIPGPTLRLNLNDTVAVRLVNLLHHETGIHWHGIELSNSADGTEVTQKGVPGEHMMPPPAPAPPGGSYLYKFKVTRPGLYWYHPHHHNSTNQVFRGLYGMIVVADPAEAMLPAGTLPTAAQTKQLVLSDITVCKAMNDAVTYVNPTGLPAADRPEWLSGATAQLGPSPAELCVLDPLNDDGSAGGAAFAAGQVPNIQRNGPGRTVEGQTVLTNGVNVGARPGTPAAPGTPAVTAHVHPVQGGEGIRLQIVNCATLRYFRLRLTRQDGMPVDLVRVGGEGGLLDRAVLDGGIDAGGFNTRFDRGEILIPPASRADVVAAIPTGLPPNSVLTLWTRDFQRTGASNPGNWAQLPTVPVMHLRVTGDVAGVAYSIVGGFPGGPVGTALRAAAGMPVTVLGAPTPADVLLNPATFPVGAKPGTNNQIEFRAGGGVVGVNGSAGVVAGSFAGTPYTSIPHIGSSRYAEEGRTLELTITNRTDAHHPFHLHGFSFQPLALEPGPGAPMGSPTYTFPYAEFRDNIDLPREYALRCRVRLDARPLKDDMTLGGALGRWFFHCHIFFHHHQGMISELVVTGPDGSEKPNVDVNGSWAYTPTPGPVTRTGTFSHPDGRMMTLTASKGTVTPAGASAGGSWSWLYTSPMGEMPSTDFVYITATDTAGRRDQAVFRLKIGAPDDGADYGDPHIHTVDGKRYDFQAVGEFVLLRDRDGMEIQARQTPVNTATPITDPHSGLTACVSLNTAIAARVGSHRISFQPGERGRRLQFFLDGKPAQLTQEGIDLGAHRVTAIDVGGETGLRVDYAHHAVLMVTPHFWSSHDIWYLNVSVSHTHADEGLMGPILPGTWLPTLPSGATVGPKPASLHDRYVALYRTFANAWRVTDHTSLFVYAPGTSTATFTDVDWPSEHLPCTLKPQFEIPGAPTPVNIPIERAKQICAGVTIPGLNEDCVFDVATTGDEVFAKGYLIAQEIRLHGSSVSLVADKPQTLRGEPLTITAIVSPLSAGGPLPRGSVVFVIDGAAAGPPVKLDDHGQARFTTEHLDVGDHKIRADYTWGDAAHRYHSSASSNLLHTVTRRSTPEGGKKGGLWWTLLILVILGLLVIGLYATLS